jgi:hypothetical protein
MLPQWAHPLCRASACVLYCRPGFSHAWPVCLRIVRFSFQHPQRSLAARPRSPVQLLLLAQKLSCLGPVLVGAFRLLPVSRLYLARPLAVNPAPLLTGNFSPRLTESFTGFFFIAYLVMVGAIFLRRSNSAASLAFKSPEYMALAAIPPYLVTGELATAAKPRPAI